MACRSTSSKFSTQAIKADGATSYLEVVSLDQQSEIVSAKAAVEIGVDVLLGGTRADDVLPILAGTASNTAPSRVASPVTRAFSKGSIEEIVESAKALAAREGVHGLDLLAYRSKEDVPALIKAVCAAVSKPVYVAGSIDTPERIAILKDAGAAGFTIGTAALDGKYPADDKDVARQLGAIIRDVAALNRHLSPLHKKNLASSFGQLRRLGLRRSRVRLTTCRSSSPSSRASSPGAFTGAGDELFLVHKGRLLMKFRDRDEIIEQGEFIVVPHGVEHCPVALDDICEVVLLEPCTALDAGTAHEVAG